MRKELFAVSIVIGYALLASADDAKQSLASRTANAPAASAAKADIGESYPVIGYLEKRNRVITIRSSPHGTVYTVATKDGKVLDENISVKQLKAQAPGLYDLVVAGNAFPNDARLHVRTLH